MSSVKFLVFEGGNTVLDMEKMNVFKKNFECHGPEEPFSLFKR